MSPHDPSPTPDADALYDEAPCGLLLTDAEGTIERVNRTFCRWVGCEPSELVGRRRFQDLLAIGGRIFHQTHLGPLLQMQGSVSEVKLDLLGAGGERLPIVVNVVRRPQGERWREEIAAFIAKDRHTYERELMLARRRAEDLAEQQSAVQEQLRRADRRKDEFLAMLAHELRNPLAPISTAAHLLQSGSLEPAALRRTAEIIARQALHLTRLVDDLLDVSRVTRGLVPLEREVVDLADVIEAAAEQSRPLVLSRGHRLRVEAPRGLHVDGDRTRLVQVVANLLNNAAKYTPQGGAIDVVLEPDAADARIGVRDTGLGIDAALLPHVFDLFTQAERTPDRSQGGLGIGLALVRSLVELHGGRVAADSEGPNRGSCFTVTLPLTTAPASPQRVPATGPAATACVPLRVMVVDDNADAAAMLVDVLLAFGHRPCRAGSGREALEHPEAPACDAFILDIGLPDMTGYELAACLREGPGAAATYIALTGYGQAHDRVLSRAAGFAHHFVKPVDLDALAASLARTVPRPCRALDA